MMMKRQKTPKSTFEKPIKSKQLIIIMVMMGLVSLEMRSLLLYNKKLPYYQMCPL